MSPLALIALVAALAAGIGGYLGWTSGNRDVAYWGAFWNVFGLVVLAICGLVWIWP